MGTWGRWGFSRLSIWPKISPVRSSLGVFVSFLGCYRKCCRPGDWNHVRFFSWPWRPGSTRSGSWQIWCLVWTLLHLFTAALLLRSHSAFLCVCPGRDLCFPLPTRPLILPGGSHSHALIWTWSSWRPHLQWLSPQGEDVNIGMLGNKHWVCDIGLLTQTFWAWSHALHYSLTHTALLLILL